MIINNEIVTTWIGRAGNLIASAGQVEGSMIAVGRGAGQAGRQVGVAEQQMRAFGTTLRYAFAGTVIFGVTNLIGKLNQLQQQMGLIAAISGPAGVAGLSGGAGLNKFIGDLSGQAIQTLTPLNELNQSAINFLSTVQGAKAGEIPEIVGRIGITARVSQTPVEDLTKAVTTLNLAAGRTNNLQNINALLREWFHLISTAPGGITAAPQIAQQLGPLAAVGRLGRLTPEQIFGFSLGGLRFGATPSTALRGAQYFMQSLFQPGKEQGKVLAAAGFTPQRLAQEGGAKFIIDYLKYIRGLGGGRGTTAVQLKQFGAGVDALQDTEAGLAPNQAIPGYSPQALAFLRNTIGRIHGIRTAAVMIAQLDRQGNVASLPQVLTDMRNQQQGIGKDYNELNKAIKDFRRQAKLQEAVVALNTMGLQLAQAFAPVLALPAGGIVDVAKLAQHHRAATKAVAYGGAAFLTALGLGRLGVPGLRNLPFGRFGGRAGAAFAAEQAIAAQASGGVGRDGRTPATALYVWVVGQIFGTPVTGGTGRGPGGTDLPPVVATGGPSRFARLLRGGAALTGAYYASREVEKLLGLKPIEIHRPTLPTRRDLQALVPFWGGSRNRPEFDEHKSPWLYFWMRNMRNASPIQSGAVQQFQSGDITAQQANRLARPTDAWNMFRQRLQPGERITGARPLKFDGGELLLDLTIKEPSGKVQHRKVHLPATVYSGGVVPSTRGKRKSVKLPTSGNK